MTADGYMLNKRAIDALVRDHRELRNEVKLLQTQLRNAHQVSDYGREQLTGITGTNGSTAYPTSGNTFPVLLQKWTFDETFGSTTVNTETGTKEIIARTTDGSYLPSGTAVIIDKQQSSSGTRWWIRRERQMPTHMYWASSATQLTAANTFYLLPFGNQEYPDGESEDSVLYSVADKWFELQDGRQWGMHLQAQVDLGQDIQTGRRIQLQIVVYENSAVPGSPDTPCTSYLLQTIDEQSNPALRGGQRRVWTLSAPVRPLLDAQAGRRYAVYAYAAHYGSCSGASIDMYVAPQLHFTEINQT